MSAAAVQTPALVRQAFPLAEEWRAVGIAMALVSRGYLRRTRGVARPGEVRVYEASGEIVVEWLPMAEASWDRDMLERLMLADLWAGSTTSMFMRLDPNAAAWVLRALSFLFPDRAASIAALQELLAECDGERERRAAT